jgi:signal transduction histidine kinase
VPIAIAGENLLNGTNIDRDMTVLLLPLQNGAELLALFVFVGGLSAATAMVIVASVALAIMISNHLVMPLLLRGRGVARAPGSSTAGGDLGTQVLRIRRLAIVVVILLGYAYYRLAGDAALAAIGLLSFAAIAQVAPAFLGGLIWRRGTANGATAGLLIGLVVWAYTLLLPSLVPPDGAWIGLVREGPLALGFLKPTALFGLDLPVLPHGVFWSLALNLLAYVCFSLAATPSTIERLQANAFVGSDGVSMAQSLRLWRASVTVAELRGTVGRYLGMERTAAAFDGFALNGGEALQPNAPADPQLLRFAEHLLSSAIGAASSRLVLSLLLKGGNLSNQAAFKLLDDASAAFQYNRDILQHGLDHAGQGITVLDKELRIVAWNRAFLQLYDLPQNLVRFGTGLEDVVRFNAERGTYGEGPVGELVAARLESFVSEREPVRLKLHPTERVIEVRSNPLPDGGLVTTYADITETVKAAEALGRYNETLERRVEERTVELQHVNSALQRAKAEAEEANASKTQFLAAASHDILQPLNAARLYVSSLVERDRNTGEPGLAENIDASLDAVEEILTTLLDISRLDAGAMKSDISSFRVDDILRQLQREFEPLAQEKGLELIFVPSETTVRSDRRLLRRLLQNLISNAIKYTPGGKVLVGCKRQGDETRVMVCDTGLGIPASKQKTVFREFQRLNQGAKVAHGLGLGLSIVERIARMLDHPLTLNSVPGRGTAFAVTLPRVTPLPAMTVRPGQSAPASTPLAGLRVLAVDNEPAILDGMQLLLAGWGCVTETAAGIAEARQKVASGRARPDVVIADYHLDDGNGISAIAEIRLLIRPSLPAVLLTADRSQAVREAAGALDIQLLNKPLKPAALRALLSQWRVTRMAAE